ncbi:hypothetical protein J2J97_27630 (plasmid) [Rhizobium bangladeshense]|uniref:hypothetical protein n=1 Tax=Rhizobium bangladeshense TaxID=1138189 RepID=UPI001A98119B|nr:hypothetical protein [Rhizobium bangladeshense]QSY97902.1 hypothetical protein J2J97_27630 [Rhizobium bangladeshense]
MAIDLSVWIYAGVPRGRPIPMKCRVTKLCFPFNTPAHKNGLMLMQRRLFPSPFLCGNLLAAIARSFSSGLAAFGSAPEGSSFVHKKD